jgi:hypothetical protein
VPAGSAGAIAWVGGQARHFSGRWAAFGRITLDGRIAYYDPIR